MPPSHQPQSANVTGPIVYTLHPLRLGLEPFLPTDL